MKTILIILAILVMDMRDERYMTHAKTNKATSQPEKLPCKSKVIQSNFMLLRFQA